MYKFFIVVFITCGLLLAEEKPSFAKKIEKLTTSTWTVEINFPHQLIGPIVGGGGYQGPERIMSVHFSPQKGFIAIFHNGETKTKHTWLWRKQRNTLHYLTETKKTKTGVKLLLPENINTLTQVNAILKKHHPQVFEFVTATKISAAGARKSKTVPITSVFPHIFMRDIQKQFTGKFYQNNMHEVVFSKKGKTTGIFHNAHKILYIDKREPIFVVVGEKKHQHLLICIYKFQEENQVDMNSDEIDKNFVDFAIKTLEVTK
ncbi:hypothetical protein [Candidatus Uabimicrobium amorphum]|uniref:Uncharacterized protein n=1 Tax=Uabimicrobium amorphum TaxID=2596890 RepID=A0A5S9IPJ4_UABAM|nr:hypothetical protein [Candidatus Uabimicrobium amorphum]BBM85524.1 hypothetical protein UABAM_03893 [Candidatus Uabimicrobium amorphum]